MGPLRHIYKFKIQYVSFYFDKIIINIILFQDYLTAFDITYSRTHAVGFDYEMYASLRDNAYCIVGYGEMGWSQHSSPHKVTWRLGLDVVTCAEMSPSRLPNDAFCIQSVPIYKIVLRMHVLWL